ncbi:hypothetical protein [Flavobacterium sp. GT3R68]|uniref:hypothetical protein n=1 Tax=Flavobacterium sp. GT3R68 TaxID=2594437 RepID=UPI000F86F21D|nr:hypothetical protein [Flavobacterium sp. GT3R68]RTY91797.1 hypothetical protein EKL32_18200 [Flavobacterium sp. GSN2]TRW90137.1 hypothetical protein FNW07_11810 [Flavobacterium sp. GT3R68]
MKTINKILLFALVIMMVSCEDIFEEDITNDTLQTISPQNNEEVESNVVNFQWTAIDGADEYRVRVYGSNQAIVLDSLVSQTHLSYPLPEGSYQWRVRGENFAYQSAYSFWSNFSMIESDDLTAQFVVQSSPNNNIYVNSANLNFSWQSMANATSYSIVVKNDATTTVVFSNPDIVGTSILLNNPNPADIPDGVYQWSVKAKNATTATETEDATIRKFSIDRVVPNQPGLTAPTNGATPLINTSITFTWTVATDSGVVMSPINAFIIEFSHDNFATAPFLTLNASTTSISQSFDTSGDYYWRVKARDEAMNISTSSAIRKFVIN